MYLALENRCYAAVSRRYSLIVYCIQWTWTKGTAAQIVDTIIQYMVIVINFLADVCVCVLLFFYQEGCFVESTKVPTILAKRCAFRKSRVISVLEWYFLQRTPALLVALLD